MSSLVRYTQTLERLLELVDVAERVHGLVARGEHRVAARVLGRAQLRAHKLRARRVRGARASARTRVQFEINLELVPLHELGHGLAELVLQVVSVNVN